MQSFALGPFFLREPNAANDGKLGKLEAVSALGYFRHCQDFAGIRYTAGFILSALILQISDPRLASRRNWISSWL